MSKEREEFMYSQKIQISFKVGFFWVEVKADGKRKGSSVVKVCDKR